jgi:hypothetical protein
MLTSCPECAHRVSRHSGAAWRPARHGALRPLQSAVFNGYDNLQAEIEAPVPADFQRPTPAVQPESVPAPEVPGAPEPAAVNAALSAYEAAQTPPEAVDSHSGDDWLTQAADASRRLDVNQMTDNPLAPRREIDAILLSELHAPQRSEPVGGRLWVSVGYASLSILLMVALLAQSAYFLRAGLVTWLPGLRPVMTLACKSLGCDLPLSRDSDALRIEASSLETDPEQAAHARLRVTFSNRLQQTQDWPYFILKLSDVNNNAMAQRVFKPQDYLAKGRSLTGGIAARSEHEFQLDLDLGNLSAAGYEVKPYYP